MTMITSRIPSRHTLSSDSTKAKAKAMLLSESCSESGISNCRINANAKGSSLVRNVTEAVKESDINNLSFLNHESKQAKTICDTTKTLKASKKKSMTMA